MLKYICTGSGRPRLGCPELGHMGICRFYSEPDKAVYCHRAYRPTVKVGRGRRGMFAAVMIALGAVFALACCCHGATVMWSATVGHEEQYSAIGSWSGTVTVGASQFVAVFGDGAGVKAKAYETEAAAKGAANGAYLGVYFSSASVPPGGTAYLSDSSGPCWLCVCLTAGAKPTGGGEIEPGVVPEPSSAMLLLVGLAGLALRRKEVR